MRHKRICVRLVAVAVLALVSDVGAETTTLRKCDSYQLDYDGRTGRLALKAPDGAAVLTDLTTAVKIRQGTRTATFRTPNPADTSQPDDTPRPDDTPELERSPFADALGKGRSVALPTWSGPDKTFRVATTVKLYDDEPFFVVTSRVRATGDETLHLAELLPLETTAGLKLDADPRNVWLIENGNGLLLDFYVRRLRASRKANSNGNILCYAPRTDRGLVLGFLTHDVGRTGIKTEVESGDPPRVTYLCARCDYDPPKPLRPGQHIDSEGGVYVALTKGRPLRAAEQWADCVAKTAGRGPFARRTLVKANLWCSQYAQGIDEQSMSREMDAAAEKLGPFGMDTFHIDAGWEKTWGDWDPRERFPRGMEFMADRIGKLGLRAGIWMAPFSATKKSELHSEHPSWFLPGSPLARSIMGNSKAALDITKPEVIRWLRELFAKSSRKWGYDIFKLDFLYYALANAPFADKTRTTQEAYRDALGVIRETIGNGRLLYPVCVPIVCNAGYADIIRLGLDNKPVWNKARGPNDQGILTSVRTLTRRYYLNRRLWISHPDVIFTGDPDTAKRWETDPITIDEARAWASLVALANGVISLGDSIATLEGPRLDLVRRIIPPIDSSARPLDLFEHRFAELWNLEIRRDFENWNVVGAFNWGLNDRWGKRMPDAPRTVRVRLADLGLKPDRDYVVHEFWWDNYLGLKRDGFQVEVPPHSCRVFAVRPARRTPQLVGTNRHISQGGAEIRTVQWDGSRRTLSCTQKVVGGWPYSITVRVPKGFTPDKSIEIRAGGSDVKSKLRHDTADLWRLELSSPKTCEKLTWIIRFDAGP